VTAYRTAAPPDLGALETTYRSPPPIRPVAVLFAIFGLPGLALVTGFQSAPGQVFAGDRTTNAALGAVFLAGALAACYAAVRKATLSVAVHENGLRWREAGKVRAVRWEEIESITGSHTTRTVAGQEVATSHVHRLKLQDGDELVMTHMLEHVEALAARAVRALDARVVPAARRQLAEGHPVAFGPVTLHPDGSVVVLGRTLKPPLEIRVEAGTVHFSGPGGEHAEIAWSQVPNAPSLVALLDLTATRASGS
jgi:hypothetical protein